MTSIRLRTLFALTLCLVVGTVAQAAAQDTIDLDVYVSGIGAPGEPPPAPSLASVSVTVHENPKAVPWGPTVLAIHGFTETAAVWEPMTAALFDHPVTKYWVKRVIALDFPGHGNSPIPVLDNNLFGNLSLHDNVAVVIQVIDSLRAMGLGPRVVMGHSMGGHAIQGVQEQLLSQGDSLAAHGVFRAILLAPVPVLEIDEWAPAAGELPPEYFRFDNGTYIVLDPPGSLFGGGYTTGFEPDGTPIVLPEAFALLPVLGDYIGAEPQVTAGQLVGAIPGLPRLSAREGAFALTKGTLLTVVGFSLDVLTPADLQGPLYRHLLGRPGLMYREVDTPDAVHNMFILNPEGMLDELFSLGAGVF